MKKLLLLAIILFALFLTGCEKAHKGLTEAEIRDILESDNPSSLNIVDTITFASNTATVNDLKIKVDGEKIILGDYNDSIQGYNNTKIIGYFDEAGQTYYFYRFATNLDGVNSIWQFAASKSDDFKEIGWVSSLVQNPTDLILVKFNKLEIEGESNDDYKPYKAYAIVGKELKEV